MFLEKKKFSWLFGGVIALIMILGRPSFAENKATDKSEDTTSCKKILKFSNLHREMIEGQSDKKKYLRISKALDRDFILPFTTLDEGQDKFPSVDLDGDGEKDEIIRNCGAGIGGLCTLYVTYSRSGLYIGDEMGRFYLGHIDNNIYLVAETYGDISPYTNKDDIRIFHVSKDSLKEMCNGK